MPRSKLPIKPHKQGRGQYVATPSEWLRHPNVRRLSSDAVRVFLEMSLGFHGHNNGQIVFSVRQAKECLHSGDGRAKRALDQFERRALLNARVNPASIKRQKRQEIEGLLINLRTRVQRAGIGKKITVPD